MTTALRFVIERFTRSICAFALCLATANAGTVDGTCFTKGDSWRTPYRVFQTSPIPEASSSGAPDSQQSPYFPATDFLTGAVPVRDLDGRLKAYSLTWINRCQFLSGLTSTENDCRVKRRASGAAVVTTKGNSYQGEEREPELRDQVRSAFSSYLNADTCSILQEMQALGFSDSAIYTRSQPASLSLYWRPDRSTATMAGLANQVTLADGTSWRYLVNICVLPSKGLSNGFSGLALDYEVNDNRTVSESTRFLEEYVSLAHKSGKEVVLAVNPLPRISSGLDSSNIGFLVSQFDFALLTLSNGATPGDAKVGNKSRDVSQSIVDSYKTQLSVLTSDGLNSLPRNVRQHIVWQVPLFNVSLSDASAFVQIVRREGYAGVSIFRNYVAQGGRCSRDVNQLTACLALDRCDGQFGQGRE